MENETHELKRLRSESIPEALEKAHRYRLLNEPLEAESICLDILEVFSENEEALVILILALTDQFAQRLQPVYQNACALLERLPDEYSRRYYEGLIFERRAKASFHSGQPASGYVAYEWFQRALVNYEAASKLSSAENADADLRWNTVVRILQRYPEIRSEPIDSSEPYLE